jgi:hypothetical protein
MALNRQTLDVEGARQGEISAASLQMGDDTIALNRIATMTVEAHTFTPWDTPKNRQTQSLYATSAIAAFFFGLLALAWWKLDNGSPVAAMIGGGVLLLLAALLGLRAMLLAIKLKKTEPYFRLVIGTSDGRKIPLVDNNRKMLEKIRDVVRHKVDTGERGVTGRFDLNLDLFDFTPIKVDAVPSKAAVDNPDASLTPGA